MPLCSSRKNTRNRVRNFVNRSQYDRDMAFRSFTKNQKNETDFKNAENEPGGFPPRPSRPGPLQVDAHVDPPVDLPGRDFSRLL